mmetsp:Transcript_58908/g.133356  ORF Transcript_58908/g.133356 Transcript_58908/m.133356 type:complete len:224 (-) Transcript_58908:58-729(-)
MARLRRRRLGGGLLGSGRPNRRMAGGPRPVRGGRVRGSAWRRGQRRGGVGGAGRRRSSGSPDGPQDGRGNKLGPARAKGAARGASRHRIRPRYARDSGPDARDGGGHQQPEGHCEAPRLLRGEHEPARRPPRPHRAPLRPLLRLRPAGGVHDGQARRGRPEPGLPGPHLLRHARGRRGVQKPLVPSSRDEPPPPSPPPLSEVGWSRFPCTSPVFFHLPPLYSP